MWKIRCSGGKDKNIFYVVFFSKGGDFCLDFYLLMGDPFFLFCYSFICMVSILASFNIS